MLPARKLALVLSATFGLCGALAAPTVAREAPFRVALTGDSIVEGNEQRAPGRIGGLGAAVIAELRESGIRAGLGFVPSHDAVPSTPDAPHSYWPLSYSGSWSFEGTFGAPASPFGPDGFSSSTGDPHSSVEASLDADHVGVLYGVAPDGGRFEVSVGRYARRLDSRGATPRTEVAWLPAAGARDRLRVSGVSNGVVRVAGIIARRGGDAVQIDQVGHSGAQALDGLAPPNMQALLALDPDLTVIMFGTNEEGYAMGGSRHEAERRLARGIAARARLARLSGACAFVPHAPNRRPRSLQARLSKVAARAALANGCDFRPELRGIWTAAEAGVSAGLTVDGIHPTASGYELMGARLARLIRDYRGRSDTR